MKKEFNSMDKALDAFLYEPAVMADTQLGEQLADIDDDDIVFSDDHMNKMKKLFKKERSEVKKEKNKARYKKFSKYALRAACILLVIIIGTGATVLSVDALRVRFLNFVLELGQPNTDYNFKDEGGTFYSDDEITLNYIPAGFELIEDVSTEISSFIAFSNGEKYFKFEINDIEVNSSIDTEAGIIEEVIVNGNKAMYVSNHNINGVVWCDNEYSFRIYGNISKEDIIKIAENVKK